jgi:hypothetical protein
MSIYTTYKLTFYDFLLMIVINREESSEKIPFSLSASLKKLSYVVVIPF